jgi:hypothetical protein
MDNVWPRYMNVLYICCFLCCTANEGPVRIQYECLVPTYVFPEMKQNYNALFTNFHLLNL